MKNKTIVAVLAAFLVSNSACNKTETPDLDYPAISITAPIEGQHAAKGQVHIAALITSQTDNESHTLHEVNVTVKTSADNTIVFTAWKSTHGLKSYSLDTSCVLNGAGAYYLEVQAKNHADKIGSRKVNFTVN